MSVLGDGNNAVYMQSATRGGVPYNIKSLGDSHTYRNAGGLGRDIELKRCTVCMDAGVVGRQHIHTRTYTYTQTIPSDLGSALPCEYVTVCVCLCVSVCVCVCTLLLL